MTNGTHIPQEELALYAMQALSPEESVLVRAHLDECGICRDELAEVAGDVALVLMSAPENPLPEGARQRFLERIGSQASPAPIQTKTSAVSIDRKARRSAPAVWVPWLAVAALVLLTIALQFHLQTLKQQLQQQTAIMEAQKAANARAQEVLNVLTAPAAQHIVLTAAKSKPAPSARAVYLRSRGALILQASNLDALPAGKTYELWVIPTQGAPIPAGTFSPDATGNASVVLPTLPKDIPAKAFGVTVENAGGSTTPTLPIVLAGAAPSPGE